MKAMENTMRRPALAASLALSLSLAAAQPAAEAEREPAAARDPAALEILKKVDTTIKAVDSVRYASTIRPTGAATAFVGNAEGDVVAEGWVNGMPARFRVHAKGTRPGSEETGELTGGGNGELYYLLDHQAKKAWVDMDPAVMGGGGRAILGLSMAEFLHDRPFDDELNAETVELLAEQAVDGEACHQIRVVYAGGQGESIWFFSKSDLLPRRRIQKFSTEQGEGAIERTIRGLEANPKLEPALFDFRLPEGYEQIDDFAP
jgi:hypothetical protein